MLRIRKKHVTFFFILSILNTHDTSTNTAVKPVHYSHDPYNNISAYTIKTDSISYTKIKTDDNSNNSHMFIHVNFRYYNKKKKKDKQEHLPEDECHEEETDQHDEEQEPNEFDAHGEEMEEDDEENDKKNKKIKARKTK